MQTINYPLRLGETLLGKQVNYYLRQENKSKTVQLKLAVLFLLILIRDNETMLAHLKDGKTITYTGYIEKYLENAKKYVNTEQYRKLENITTYLLDLSYPKVQLKDHDVFYELIQFYKAFELNKLYDFDPQVVLDQMNFISTKRV